jgi:hypothetical protein
VRLGCQLQQGSYKVAATHAGRAPTVRRIATRITLAWNSHVKPSFWQNEPKSFFLNNDEGNRRGVDPNIHNCQKAWYARPAKWCRKVDR